MFDKIKVTMRQPKAPLGSPCIYTVGLEIPMQINPDLRSEPKHFIKVISVTEKEKHYEVVFEFPKMFKELFKSKIDSNYSIDYVKKED